MAKRHPFKKTKPGEPIPVTARQLESFMLEQRQKGHVIPLSFKTMRIFEDAGFKLKEIIMKEQHNCRATGYWKTNSIKYNFLLLAHEYLFIFKKDKK